ncbi:MAG: hypothetical protein AAF511_01805 [Pseudomonadota bacterium]
MNRMAYFLIGRLFVIAGLLGLFAAGIALAELPSGAARLDLIIPSVSGLIFEAQQRLPDLTQSFLLIAAAIGVAILFAWPLAKAASSNPSSKLSRLVRFKTALGPVLPTFIVVVFLGLVDRTGVFWSAESIARASAEARFAFGVAVLSFALLPAVYIAVDDWRRAGVSPLSVAAIRIGSLLPGLMVVEALLLGSGLGARMVAELLGSDTGALSASVFTALGAILLAAMILDGVNEMVLEQLA